MQTEQKPGIPIAAAPEVGSPRGTTAEEEKDTTARALLEEEGFDPDDVRQADTYGRTPLLFFIAKGNITMVQHLLVREAECRTVETDGHCPRPWAGRDGGVDGRSTERYGGSPLCVAAAFGQLEILKLLLSQDGGAKDDLRTQNRNGDTPLRIAFYNGHFEVVYWLILNGALSPTREELDAGNIDDMVLRRDLFHKGDYDKRLTVLSWAQEVVTTHGNVVKSYLTTEATRPASSFLMALQLMEQRLQTLRQLIRLLSAFITEVPFVVKNNDEDKHEEPNSSVSRKGGVDTTTTTTNLANNSNKNAGSSNRDDTIDFHGDGISHDGDNAIQHRLRLTAAEAAAPRTGKSSSVPKPLPPPSTSASTNTSQFRLADWIQNNIDVNTASSPSSIGITQELLASSSQKKSSAAEVPTTESKNGADNTTKNNSKEHRVQRDEGKMSARRGDNNNHIIRKGHRAAAKGKAKFSGDDDDSEPSSHDYEEEESVVSSKKRSSSSSVGGAVDPQQQQHQQGRYLIRNSMLLGSGGQDGGQPLPMDRQNRPNPKLTKGPTSLAGVSAPAITEQEQQQVADADAGAGTETQTDKTAAAAAATCTTATTTVARSKGEEEEGGTNKKRKKTTTTKNCLELTLTEKQQHKQQRQQQIQEKTMPKKQQKSNIRTSRNTAARDGGGNDVDTNNLPAPSAAAVDRDDDNDAEDDDAVAVVTDTHTKRKKSDHQSRNIPPKKKPKRSIQDNNNRNISNLDDDDIDDGIHCDDDGDNDSDKTNNHPRRNGRRAAAKDKKKYIDDDNDDDDDDSEASSHDYEEEESVVASKKRSRSSKFRSSSTCRRSYFASSSSSSSSSSSTYDDNSTNLRRSKRFTKEEYEARPPQPEERKISTRVGTRKRTGIAQPPQRTHRRVTMSPPGQRKSTTGHRASSRVTTGSATAAAQTIKKKSGTKEGNTRKRTNTASASSRNKKRTTNGKSNDSECSTSANKKRSVKPKSARLPSKTVDYLKAWMKTPEHIAHPYPTEQEKVKIMKDTGIELNQLTSWFSRIRKRSRASSDNHNATNLRPTRDAKWMEMYGKLVDYKKEHDSTCVPSRYRDDPELGKWVGSQRTKKSKLSADRINRLNLIGFVWNQIDTQWIEMYKRLCAYKKQYKTTCVSTFRVSSNSKDYLELGQWVGSQRKKKSKLTADRESKLNSIGFVWNKLDTQWTIMYDRLVKYKKQYKHTCVPLKFDADRRLGNWVSNQRRYYRKNTLANDRINRLISIGFVWNALDAKWMQMYNRLVKYKKQNKTTCVSILYPADPELGQWVSSQRTFYNNNKSKLTADRITQLNSIGFVWKMRQVT